MSGRSVVVRGRGSTSDAVVDALTDRDDVSVTRVDAGESGRGADVGDADLVFAAGEGALLGLASSPTDRPVVPVETGAGRYDLSAAHVTAVVDAVELSVLEPPDAVTGQYDVVVYSNVDPDRLLAADLPICNRRNRW